ncbi:PAS domain-containing protein [Methylorubrum zatmanii]|uniref:Blue-light-activated histidine kinase n=1 Tax=Methylorubrum zatmanii TaxID=29429 RepID=A0ABW1WXY5_9HYPH|nr:PAS domain-containing protein [Methylorubrum zatmanii]MBD8907814.1 histidine kinase [Methylorubrum zatmanii]
MNDGTAIWPFGSGEMVERVRAHDWAATPLGAVERWPQSLKTAVELTLGSRLPSVLAWGPLLHLIYNDAHIEVLGAKHPAALGRPFTEVWPEPHVQSLIEAAFAGGSIEFIDQFYELPSRQEQPIGWFTGSWIPVRDETGAIAGLHTVGMETTERVLAEQALRESEEHLRHTVDFNPQVSWTAMPDGTIDFASHRFREWTGVDGLGRSGGAVQHPDDAAALLAAWMDCVRTGRVFDVQHRVRMRESGSYRWLRSRAYPRRDPDGRIVRWYGTSEDIHEYKLAEQALRAREEQQAFLLRLSDALRALADPTEIQAVACRLLGDHLDVDRAHYAAIYETEGYLVIEREHLRSAARPYVGTYPLSFIAYLVPLYKMGLSVVVPDVSTAPQIPEAGRVLLLANDFVAWIGVPLIKHGELVGAFSVMCGAPRAWTEAEAALVGETAERIWAAMERARAERAAREADMRLRTMADAAPVLIWDVDSTGVIFANDHYLDFFGAGLDAVGGMGWANFLHPDDAEGYLAAYNAAYEQRRPFTSEARLLRADGQYRWLSNSGRPLGENRFVGVSIDVTERHDAEDRLRRNNAVLQAINVVFGETLGVSSEEELARISLEVAEDLTGSAVSFLGEIDEATGCLGSLFFSDRSRAQFAGLLPGDGTGGSMPGRAIQGLYGRMSRDGRGFIVNDPVAPSDGRAAMPADLPLRAFLGVPLKQGGTVRGMIGLGNREGGYRPEDLAAAEALVPAIWHALRSKRAELRLRESEERFRQFAEASSDVLWIRDAGTLSVEYVSPALLPVYGVEAGALVGREVRHWGALMVPEDRERTLHSLTRAVAGESLVNEFRIMRPNDGAFRWIRSTLFPLRDEQGRVRRIGGLSSDTTEAKLLIEHQAVLLAELQHRVRNIMAVTRSIVARTGERAETVAEYASLVGGRLLTLARVQALLTRSAGAGVKVATIVHDEVSAQALREDQYDLSGPEIELPPKAAEILTLAVHELATNALKYGALSVPEGCVRVRWGTFAKRDETWLGFDWAESSGSDPVPVTRRGFGRELIEGRLPYELSGTGRWEIGPDGVRCHLEFPLRDRASILGTDAPQRATVCGGVLDMTSQADLSGYRILVVEDDYYLATDTARALQSAGAEVVGPCPSEEAAREALAEVRPTAALVDINLGDGPSFTLAGLLRENGIPFVFVTGYDEGVIPAEFSDVERLQKPVELRRVITILAETLRRPAP